MEGISDRHVSRVLRLVLRHETMMRSILDLCGVAVLPWAGRAGQGGAIDAR
ncbi:hypothetical protein [Puniceibacterium confluentis]|uniref:hypothetical protein n=1 Tax=Puniceibacterium confluentis TaxID=1958944 RepID=UPI001C970DAF|nr:hypothetical protein [Puniceibacterium confluentis]